MSTTEHPMPDFVDALERHLRHAAAEHAASSLAVAFPLPEAPVEDGDRRHADEDGARPGRPVGGAAPERGRSPRLRLPVAAGSLAVVAALIVLVLVLSGGGPATPRAFGEPLVVRTPLVTLPKGARPGSVALTVMGPDSRRITKGHAFPVQNGTAYLYRNARGVCLNAPDPTSKIPEVERGVTCVTAANFRRFGILGAFEGADEADIVAAIPDGAKPPTVSVRGGAPRTLKPSDIGVIAYRTTEPTTLTLFGPGDETSRSQYLQPPGTPIEVVPAEPNDPVGPVGPGGVPGPAQP